MSDDMTGWNDNADDPDDETIYADSVGSSSSTVDQLAARTVDAVLGLLRRANRLAAGALMITGGICVLGFLLGLAALDGDARNVWIFFGGLGVLVAVGSVVHSMWQLAAVGRSSSQLTDEFRSLIRNDRESERAVIETVQVTENSVDVGVVQVSRGFSPLRDLVSGNSTVYPALSTGLRAITRLPFSLLLAAFVALTFIPISLIFLLILIF